MVTKRDNRPTTDRVNMEQSASGRLEGRVLQFNDFSVTPATSSYYSFPSMNECTTKRDSNCCWKGRDILYTMK